MNTGHLSSRGEVFVGRLGSRETVVLESSDVGAPCMSFPYSCGEFHVMCIQHSSGVEIASTGPQGEFCSMSGTPRRANLGQVGMRGRLELNSSPILGAGHTPHFYSSNEQKAEGAFQTGSSDLIVSTRKRAALGVGYCLCYCSSHTTTK